jgi:hypothetical protein
MNLIDKEVAEEELAKIINFFEVDPEEESWAEERPKLLKAIQKGRVTLDEQNGRIVLTLASPIELQNGPGVTELYFSEPTAGSLKVLDKYKETEKMAKTIHLVSKISGKEMGVIERLGSRDLGVVSAIASLFF